MKTVWAYLLVAAVLLAAAGPVAAQTDPIELRTADDDAPGGEAVRLGVTQDNDGGAGDNSQVKLYATFNANSNRITSLGAPTAASDAVRLADIGGVGAPAGPYVQLQSSTPGSQQTGHLSLSGTGLFGGSVGIGTTDPQAKLHIGGTAGVDGIKFPDGTTQTTAFTGAGVPTGTIVAYGGSAAPSGWFLCDGAAASRTTYSALWGVLGTTYGAGDWSTTFNLPDLRQRFPLGKAAAGTGSTLGGTGGVIDHAHTGPSHSHTFSDTVSGTTSSEAGHAHSVPAGEVGFGTGGGVMEGVAGEFGFTTNDGILRTNRVTATMYVYHINNGGSDTSFYSGGYEAGFPASTTSTNGAHSHTLADSTASGTTSPSGTDNTGSNNPPFQVVNYIIKY